MSAPQIIITIPEPCSENWEAMTPADRGRFCASCQKTVIDFTILTDREIYNMLTAAKGQHFCGHFFTAQLDKAISLPQQQYSFPRMFISKVAAAFLFLQTITIHARAQVIKPKTYQQNKTKGKAIAVKDKPRGISGSVKDHTTGAPLNAIEVQVKGTTIKALTDKKGNFFLALPDAFALKEVTLTAKYTDTAMKLSGTVILDEVVEIDSMGSNGVTLYRYPEIENEKQTFSAYRPPIIETREYRNGGAISVTEVRNIPTRRRWRFFHRKKRRIDE